MIRVVAAIGFAISLLFILADLVSGAKVPVFVVACAAIDLAVLAFSGRGST